MSKNNSQNTKIANDLLYAKKQAKIDTFSFNDQVADVFPDMINRSVPSYQTITEGIGKIARMTCSDGARIYDLGCSLGNVSLAISQTLQNKSVEIIGVDNSLAMIERCLHYISNFSYGQKIKIIEGDLTSLNLLENNLTVTNFTLQFVKPDLRQNVINSIFQSLLPGGVFVMSEKIRFEDNTLNELMIELHHDFKRENGYSDLEISQKRTALESVMILDSVDTHLSRLRSAGFKQCQVWYQHYNFISILAIK